MIDAMIDAKPSVWAEVDAEGGLVLPPAVTEPAYPPQGYVNVRFGDRLVPGHQ